MKTLIPCLLLVSASEFAWGLLSDYYIIYMVEKNPLWASILYAGSTALSFGILRTIARRNWGISYIMAAIVGGSAAAWIVASR